MGERVSVAKRIGMLEFVDTVDNMLVEGVSTGDVASFIQHDQGELSDVSSDTLKRTLYQRKQDLLVEIEAKTRRVRREYGDDLDDDNGENDGDEPATEVLQNFSQFTPAAFARSILQKQRKSIDKLVDMEATYLAQRERTSRMLIAEGQAGLFSEAVGDELSRSFDMLAKMTDMEIKLGIAGMGADRNGVLNFEGYSSHTAQVLAKPESRRKLVGLVERLERSGKLKAPADDLIKQAKELVDVDGESVDDDEKE